MATFPWAHFFGCYYNESFDKYKTYHKPPAEDETAFIPFLRWTVNRQHQGKRKNKQTKKRQGAKEILQGLKQ